jgi:gp16 family phage-associated protein
MLQETAMQLNKLVSHQEVKERFLQEGRTVASWARSNGVDPRLTAAILKEERTCRSGQSHKIAVLLGLKNGVIVDD